jgi:hypothetical protein
MTLLHTIQAVVILAVAYIGLAIIERAVKVRES